MKPTLGWYLHRARAMSPDELLFRFQHELRKRRWRHQAARAADGRVSHANWNLIRQESPALHVPPDHAEARALLAEADSYLRHEWHFFGLSGVTEQPINWLADPTSGVIAPARFAFDINYRDPASVGNIKVIWEKNRHHHLTVLAVAYALTKNERYSAEVADQIMDWVRQNPYLIGVNWNQTLESGIRLISWVWCERLLRGSTHHARVFGPDSPAWTSIHQHQQFIEQAYSRGSSANNHLIGEMSGLLIASTAWPIFEQSGRWQEFSRQKLEQEIVRQTFPSGINREMAFSYHIFALEFFLLALTEADRAGVNFSGEFRTRAARMIEAMACLTDNGGNLLRYGDGDEGMAVQLQALDGRRDAWLYRAGHALLGMDVPAGEDGALAASVLDLNKPDKSNWTPPSRSLGFKDAGLYVLTAKRDTPREVFILADAGPHGYLSIAAHAHADALSFTLSVGGKPILVDPGTYAYHTDPHWREYFRSTRAHNTVVVDDLDQSVQAGPFMWTKQAKTTVKNWSVTDSGGTLVGSHDGYARIGVIHQRSLELQENAVTIKDSLQGSGSHQVMLCFHTAPECRVEQISPTSLLISREDIRVRLNLSDTLQITLARGEENAGWYSPRFGVKQETCSILARMNGPLPIALTTTLEIA